MEFVKTYWVQIVFICTTLVAFFKFGMAMIEATKCSLRNDILSIYDRCKENKKITQWQLESIEHSYELYKALKGNSFVENLYKRVKTFEVID
jgi:hypothetical protein